MVGGMGCWGPTEAAASGRNVRQSEGMTVDRGHLRGGASQHTHDRPRRGGSAVSGRQQAGRAQGRPHGSGGARWPGRGRRETTQGFPGGLPARLCSEEQKGKPLAGMPWALLQGLRTAGSLRQARPPPAPSSSGPRSWHPVAVATRGPLARSAGAEGGWLDGWTGRLWAGPGCWDPPALLRGPRDELGGRLAS